MASYHRLDDLKVSLNSINNSFKDIIPQYKELIDLKYQNDVVYEKLTQFERDGFTVVPKTKQRVEEYNKKLTNDLTNIYNKCKELESMTKQLHDSAVKTNFQSKSLKDKKEYIVRNKMVAVKDYTTVPEFKEATTKARKRVA